MSLDEFGTTKSASSDPTPRNYDEPNVSSNGYFDPNNADKDITSPRQWVYVDSDKFSSIGKTIKKLESKIYSISVNNRTEAFVFSEVSVKTDSLVRFTDSIIDTTMKEIEDFWGKEKEFKKYGFTHHRGYMLYGPAGGGKTSLLNIIMSEAVKRGSLIFVCDCNPKMFISAIREFRKVEPERNAICIFEDIATRICFNILTEILTLAKCLMLLQPIIPKY
jgi:hypothetical protein